ncbi:MAG: beta-ketoacyl-ACP synthase III [Vampirovibrionia bacterium]
MKAVKIICIGAYAPETVISNNDLSNILDTSDEWIYSRTGIKNRHLVNGNETSVSLAKNASVEAIAYAGLNPEDIDCIIVGTSMPDNLYPSCACELQAELGCSAVAFDVTAACTGFIYAMSIATQYIKGGCFKNVLVVGTDVHSRFLDWEDRGTCVLFGDGAGAMVLAADEDINNNDVLSVDINADGKRGKELTIALSGKNCPLVDPNDQKPSTVYMNGREIYKFAVTDVPKTIQKALTEANLAIEDIDFLVPHQANVRILKALAEKLQLPIEKVIHNVEEYGNTSSASIPLAMKEALKDGLIKKGDILVLTGFGAGLTWGTAVVKWNATDKR